MSFSRRKFLVGLLAMASSTVLGESPVKARAEGAGHVRKEGSQTLVLTATATRTGEYLYMPFQVQRGVNRIDIRLTKSGEASVGVGLFDQRGVQYQSAGFRGVYGEERSEFFVGPGSASQAFIPGRIHPGTWTAMVPVFKVTGPPVKVTVTVTLSFGAEGKELRPGPELGIVKDKAGWYRGDLHCHTPESSDAWASGSALTPAQWGDEARRIGLDFVSLTDHNVITQNWNLKQDAGPDVLLIPGEEMTNWFHGHATVTGIKPGDWLDWRQSPLGLPLGTGEGRIQQFFAAANKLGAYTSAAHPMAAHLSWQFFADAEVDRAALPHGIEVWNGPWQPDDEASLKKWDELLLKGMKIWANGGSDTHGVKNNSGVAPGVPATVVYAESLSKQDIVSALKKGRSFVTRTPKGPELYLTATGPQGQRQMVGDTIYGAAADTAKFSVLVKGGAGMRLILLRDGAPVHAAQITKDEQVVTLDQRIGAGGYVRAELRGSPALYPNAPQASRGDMEALTNPIFLVQGPQAGDDDR